jgi:cytochrome c oxidase subunit 2
VNRRGLQWGSAACASALLAACNTVQSALAPVADESRAIERVWDLMLWICGPMYALVLLALGYALWRNRGNGHGRAGDRALWFGLLGFSVLTAGLLTVLTAQSYVQDRRLHAPVVDPVNVRITAKQWWWQVEYLDADPSRQFTTANELHLPVDRPARIELASADVIHSLWIPVLNGKEDLIPGHANTITMTPRKVGRYRGQCAEFCGLQHANMALDVQVDDAAAFAAWQAHQRMPAPAPTTPTAIAGRTDFNALACALCHAIGGTPAGGVVGPNLTHLASRRTLAAGALPLDRGTLETWIIDPQRHKPGTNMPAVPLQPQQLSDITDYLMTLD